MIGGGGLGAGRGAGELAIPSMQASFICVVDLRGAHVERAAEDEGEAEDVVDLVGKSDRPVAMIAPGGGLAGEVRQDLGIGVSRARR
jgi:hypothetical protein